MGKADGLNNSCIRDAMKLDVKIPASASNTGESSTTGMPCLWATVIPDEPSRPWCSDQRNKSKNGSDGTKRLGGRLNLRLRPFGFSF